MAFLDPRLIEQVRRFDRFYEIFLRRTSRTAANDGFSANDARVLNELGWTNGGGSGAWLSSRLDLDPGRICRTLKKLEAFGLVASRASPADARMRTWDLTPLGRLMADRIEDEHRARVATLLLDVMPADHARLLESMGAMERILHAAWLRAG